MPTVDDFTHNGGAPGSVVGSFDLLCLPGMVISFLGDEAFTCSTGAGLSASMLYVEDSDQVAKAENVSAGSTDSSVLGNRAVNCHDTCGDCASVFRSPFHETIYLDLAAVLIALGGFVALLLETAAHGLPQEGPAEATHGS